MVCPYPPSSPPPPNDLFCLCFSFISLSSLTFTALFYGPVLNSLKQRLPALFTGISLVRLVNFVFVWESMCWWYTASADVWRITARYLVWNTIRLPNHGNSGFDLVLTSNGDLVPACSYQSLLDDAGCRPSRIYLGLLRGRFPGDEFGNLIRQMCWKGRFHQRNVNNHWEDLLNNPKATIAKDGCFG